MMVDEDSHAMEYQGHIYAFCSQQCRERFETNPHLYVGRPGHAAPKKTGQEIIKKRTLKLDEPLTETQSRIISSEIGKMMGIKDVSIEADCIHITYDLLQATVEQIEISIEKTGEKLGHGIAEKLQRALIHYLEEIEL
ncbi:MAG: YHS domain-containing protein, partial [Gammaproteobacteria bacterium]|nr:YHS domain-containing protein [Gammaproteobacteria bacterium]